jgi:Uma2 family endonuclease
MTQRLLTPAQSDERLTMTYEEFLEWAHEETRAEWVDGEVIVFMPPKPLHQHLVLFLARLIAEYVDLRKLGIVMIAPFDMRLAQTRSSREPDIAFIAQRNVERITELRVEGPADLVIEIVSDDSVMRDRREKLLEYQRAGVPEYWIVDAREGRQVFEPFTLTDRGVFQLITPDGDGRIQSAVLPGFWIDPAWLWQDPLPSPLRVLGRIVPDLLSELQAEAESEIS